MCIVLSSTIGSGVPLGTHGTRLGIGDIIPAGGTYIAAGHATDIGHIAMLSIIATTDALSAQDVVSVEDMWRCRVT